ncbi:choice-of-anchor J domain-containing protein [Prevotella dentasini]|uniref:choice-of-anchor J domain-containing protein n=1 Tax=Prevotella dentasini TaxID=589537 RepID=UPI000A71EBDB|nr:choice-of-anchor J domain-containing protein [Prevotella dentasini]
MKQKLILLLGMGTMLSVSPVFGQNLSDQQLIRRHALQRCVPSFGATLDGNETVKVAPTASAKFMNNTQKYIRRTASKAPRAVYEAGWSVDFNTADQWEQFTTIDANGDKDAAPGHNNGIWSHFLNEGNGAAMYYYNAKNAANDWLISPGISLKGGKTYYVSFKTRCVQETYPERIEVKYGNAATAEAMTGSILEPTEVGNTDYHTYTETLSPSADGVYYVGFHAISDAFRIALYVDDISVVAAPEAKSPGKVTDVAVIPDASAALRASVTFTAPEVSYDGSPLTSLDGVKVLLNGTQVSDVNDIQPGERRSLNIDNIPQEGMNVFTFLPYNQEGDGETLVMSAYIGLDLPSAPGNVSLSDNPDNIVLSWDEARAAHHGAFFPEDVTYHIHSVSYNSWGEAQLGEEVGTAVGGETSYSLGYGADEGTPRQLELAVTAENGKGVSETANISNTLLLGKPDRTPYHESFVNGKEEKILIPFAEGQGVTFQMAGAGRTVDDAADEDGGCLYLQTFMNDSVGVNTFKISLRGTRHPMLAFRQKNATATGTFYVYVMAPDKGTVYLDTQELTAADDQWLTRKYDLSQFATDRYVQIGFALADKSNENSTKVVFLDNIHVGDLVDKDLAVSVAADKEVMRNETTKIRVRVCNVGDQQVDSYRILLAVDGKPVADQQVNEPLASLGVRTFELPYTAAKLEAKEQLDMVVSVVAENDGNTDNNSAEVSILVAAPDLSPVQNLVWTRVSDGVKLSWEEPLPLMAKTDDFEDYIPWAISGVGNWTLVDGDGASSAGDFVYDANGAEIPYAHEGDPFAFIVFNPHDFNGYDLPSGGIHTFDAYSGSQSMASLHGTQMDIYTFNQETVANDDWMISPELPGNAQTISFYANNVVATNQATGETVDLKQTVEILYSATDADTAHFKLLKTVEVMGGKWQKLEAELPEGAKYFAIRNVTAPAMAYILLIDDVTYHVGGGKAEKYNVYRDGTFLSSTTSLFYTDTDVPEGSHVYQVTAVYAEDAESAPLTVEVVASGIDILSSGNVRYDVYSLDGVQVRKQSATLDGLKAGVYVVNGKKMVVK